MEFKINPNNVAEQTTSDYNRFEQNDFLITSASDNLFNNPGESKEKKIGRNESISGQIRSQLPAHALPFLNLPSYPRYNNCSTPNTRFSCVFLTQIVAFFSYT